jgi:hypothetical protein
LEHIRTSPEGRPPFTKSATLSEVLKTLFNIISHSDTNFGPELKVLVHVVVKIFNDLPLSSKFPFSPPHSHAAHLLLYANFSDYQGMADNLVQTLCSNVLYPELLYYLVTSKRGMEDHDSVISEATFVQESARSSDRLVPLFQLLGNIYCQSDFTIKVKLRELLAPKEMDRGTDNFDEITLPKLIIRLLTSVDHQLLKEASGQLLYTIFDNDGTQFEKLYSISNLTHSTDIPRNN